MIESLGETLAYQALYRKFRPLNFDEVSGQEHILTTLKNQIKYQRIGHAYLFCGTRGTGKTTIAKIFAKAVNCLHPQDGNPCGECELCLGIQKGNLFNVIEVDAASNNGVDHIREIIEEVTYPPTTGQYKVYIIDEVHMLSKGAYNALLKTLEEPPSYVIFILATTEVHKIPQTILSRCQRYDFHRLEVAEIVERMRHLLESEQKKATGQALELIARKGDGSMRDALSILEQCLAFDLDQEELTRDRVLEILGTVSTQVYETLTKAVVSQDVSGIFGLIDEIFARGIHIREFCADYIQFLRNLLLLKVAPELKFQIEMDQETLERLSLMSQEITEAIFIRYIKIFSDLVDKFRTGSDHRILLETALIKLCQPSMDHNVEHLLARIDMLESQVSQLAKSGIAIRNDSTKPVLKEESKPEDKVVEPTPATPEDLQKIRSHWHEMTQKILAENKVIGYSIPHYQLKFREGEAQVLYLVCTQEGLSLTGNHKEMAQSLIEDLIVAMFGVKVKVYLADYDLQKKKQLYEVSLAQKIQETIDFPIEVVDN